ncbi:G1 S-specific cyclin-D2-like [Brachionus plicatilis]|uniref:G1 S-specific cyclin-D2-like n=1 Tax=Brachionus plicatilis TaxID=10195 RepID=A0A3M7S4T1_BRAPC|nr:G1 S-specific cyclin-D2-like [Brachionus plicatilis]
MLGLEDHYQTKQDFFTPQISVTSRQILLRWILDITQQEHQHIDVFHLAASLFDQLMSVLNSSNFPTDKSMLQLFGTSCLFIASKLRDNRPLSSTRLVEYADYTFSLSQLLDCEQFVLQNLKWDTERVTPNDYFDLITCYIDGLDLADAIKSSFDALAAVCKIEPELSAYPSHTIALSIMQSILRQSKQLDAKIKIDALLLELNLDATGIDDISEIVDSMMDRDNKVNSSAINCSFDTDGLLDLALFKEFLDEELFIHNSTDFNDSSSDTSDLTKSFDESFTFLITPPTINFHHIQSY